MKKHTLAFVLIIAFKINIANATLVDDFNGGDMTVFPTTPSSETTKLYNNAFGGKRTINIEKTGPRIAYSDVMFGQFSLNTAAGTSAISTITWNSASSVDLIEKTDNNAFSLDIDYIDQNNVSFNLFITDISANTDSFSLLDAEAGIQNIFFSSFSGIDFHNVTDISLQIEGGLESDLTLNSLSTERINVSAVPTPAALVMFSSSLVILSLSRRKVNN